MDTLEKDGELPEDLQLEVSSYLDERESLRFDIDSAMAVYNFLEELDLRGGKPATWGMTEDLEETMKDCLFIIKTNIELLKYESE